VRAGTPVADAIGGFTVGQGVIAVLKNFNGWEIIIVLAIILLLFGARKLPDLARSIGASAKEFRKGLDDGMDDDADSDSEV
jgi:sec-independent protein translocase protein TatA